MMHATVSFQDERLEVDIPADRVVASWTGPAGLAPSDAIAAARAGFDQPSDFPPLRQMIVPGDRVTIALDPMLAEPHLVLDVLGHVLKEAGVEPADVTLLAPTAQGARFGDGIRPGIAPAVHDPSDRGQLAYLAATNQGRRIYLNRLLTDADVVIPVGRVGYDPIMGYRGPWSVLFPELSERASIDTHRGRFRDEVEEPGASRKVANLDESFEVSWLLGSQFHVGVVPGTSGLCAVVAGREQAVRERSIASLNSSWTLKADSRAELVVVGIGGPDRPATIDDLTEGLATACRLVQHGGKIVALSRVRGNLGPALQKLVGIDDPKQRLAALRGHEADDDFVAARRLALALAWADVFVLTGLAPDVVEGLSLIDSTTLNRLAA